MNLTHIRKVYSKINFRQFIKTLKTIINLFIILAFIFCGTIALLTIKSQSSGKAPSLGVFQIYSVLGGSMEPNIHTGSIVIVKRKNLSSLNASDIITFINPGDKQTIVTHRIVDITQADYLTFITRGDANNANDLEPVPADNIIGQVVLTIPYIGFIMNFSKSKTGLVLLIIIPGVAIIIFQLLMLLNLYIKSCKTRNRLVLERINKISKNTFEERRFNKK